MTFSKPLDLGKENNTEEVVTVTQSGLFYGVETKDFIDFVTERSEALLTKVVGELYCARNFLVLDCVFMQQGDYVPFLTTAMRIGVAVNLDLVLIKAKVIRLQLDDVYSIL